jgi:hypothetical protein
VRFPLARLGILVLAAALTGPSAGLAAKQAADVGGCAKPRVDQAYAGSIRRALSLGKDIWGNRLLRSRTGPTYEGALRYLKPLLLAAGPKQPLTKSGVHYLVFGWPAGGFGANKVALHVADGSEVLGQKTNGPSLNVTVGSTRLAPYGACLTRLSTPELYNGYLPILETSYSAEGVQYQQESFATRIPGTPALVSFVRVAVDMGPAPTKSAEVRFTPSAGGLRLADDRLVRGAKTYMFVSQGGTFNGKSVTYTADAAGVFTFSVGWLLQPVPAKHFLLNDASFKRARDGLVNFWSDTLAGAATFVVPEERVLDAERSLLIQNMLLAWRYSSGNTYEQFSVPEAVDTAQVMGGYGFRIVDESILRDYFWRKFRDTSWKRGELLLGTARYYALFHDRRFVEAVTPVLTRYVAALGSERAKSGRGILAREPYSSDIGTLVYGLHSQAVAWDGLRSMARVWTMTGHSQLAGHARALAAKLGAGLRLAVRKSQRRLRDGTLFIPVRLYDHESPYGVLTATRNGSYWNLVMPYALASGLFEPHGAQATGVLRYMLGHGSRILGLVRAIANPLYRKPRFPTSGTDQVYGVNVARFLADNDQSEQLILSLYGQLAAAMTPGTFVSGEGATIAPLHGQYFRTMYLPPNSAGNAAFLETLRLMLVHETRDASGSPQGLELAFATPRPWLMSGKEIAVNDAPTSFGPISYTIDAGLGLVSVSLEAPRSAALRTLRLRLRLPAGERMTGITVNGNPFRRFDSKTETIDLSGLSGSLWLQVSHS